MDIRTLPRALVLALSLVGAGAFASEALVLRPTSASRMAPSPP